MKKIYLKLIIVISIIILSICSLAFADNNTINEIEDINMLFTDELINNVLNDNLQEQKELLENNQKAIPDKVLQDGKYRIAMYSNLNIGLDINAGLQENGANVLLWDWYEENNLQKQFNIQYDETDGYYTITNVNSGKLLTVQDGQKNIIQYKEYGTDAQKWKIIKNSNGSYSIISKLNNLYLDIQNGNISNGANVQVYEGNGTGAQQFSFVEIIKPERTIKDGTYRIAMFSNSNIGVDVDAGSKENGANVLLWEWYQENNLQKQFNINYDEVDGYYTIANTNSGKLLTVQDSGTINGTNVWQYEANGTNSQKWQIVKNPNGSYSIISKLKHLCLDVQSGNISNGANVQVYESNGSNAQQFKIIEIIKPKKTIEEGTYRIAMFSNPNIGIDIDAGLKNNGANVLLWDWYEENNTQKKFNFRYDETDGYYTITNVNSGKLLDVQNGGMSNGTNVWQYEENGSDAQKWLIQKNSNGSYSIISKSNGLYLDIQNGNIANGGNVQVYEGNGSVAQQFYFIKITKPLETLEDGTYRIAMFSNQNIGLDINGGSKDNGANVLLWEWYEENNIQKKFNIKYDETDGYYTITNVNSGKLLDTENGGNTNGTNVWQYEENGTSSQKWKIIKNNNGSYSIISKYSGLYLDISNGNIANGGNVQVYEGNNSVAQQFMFIKLDNQIEKTVEDGIYEITSSLDSSKAFDMTDNSTSDGTQLQLWDSDGFIQQRYKITYNTSYYTITAMNSNKVLAINDNNQVIQKTASGDIKEKWSIKSFGNNKYTFVSLSNDYCIDIPSANASNGVKLQVYEENNSDAQKFYLTNRTPMQGKQTIKDGIYKIGTAINSSQVFDITDGSLDNGKQIQLWGSWEATQQNFEITYNGDGYYTIKSKLSNKVLAVDNANVKNGTKIIQQDEQGTDQEKWIIKDEENNNYSIISKCNNYYIDVPSANCSDGIKIQMYENNVTNSQRFQFIQIGTERTIEDGTYRISLFNNENLGLDIESSSRRNCANVLIWEWFDNNIQKEFNLQYIEADGCYIITNVNSGKVLDAENGGTTNYTNVWQYEYNGSAAQKWFIIKDANGSYSIHSKASGLCLDVENGNLANGSNVRLYESNNSAAQEFKFIKQKSKATKYMEDGLYKIVTKINQDIGFDIADGSIENGANLQLWKYHGVNQEKFILSYEDGYYTIVASHSNKVLELKSNSKIEQNEKNSGNNMQKWILIPDGSGAYNIVSKANGLYMDVENGNINEGISVRGYQGNGTQAQLFVFGNCGINIDTNKYPGIQERVNELVINHPNWQFEVLYTGIDFYTAVQGEYEYDNRKANLVDTNVYKGDWIAPNPYVSGNWASASYNGIAYFMDSRNFLNDVDAFQFVDLADYYNSGATIDSIQYQVNGTFLNNFAEDVRISCEHQNVNPYYIIARLFQEQGRNGSITIYMDGGDGKTYFNPFNIGAQVGNDFATALAKAKEQGWDSMQKGIEGGITFVKQNYLDAKQNTLYLNKFDVNPNSPGGFYTHQYMQNLSAAYSEARTFRGAYADTGTLDNTIKFIIPVYENMPESPAAKPTGSGSSTDPSFPAISDQGPKNVQVFDIQTTLKVRSGPGQEYAEIEKLQNGTILLSIERYVNGWQKVITPSGTVGYCSGEYLQFINDVTNCNERVAISTTGSVNIRIGPGQGYTSLGTFRDGTTGTRILKDVYFADGYTWDLIILDDGTKGFVASKYLRII